MQFSEMGVWLTLVLSLILLTDSALAESLYPDTSDVLSLCGETQFHGAVFGSGTVWQVEFYQSSCGHCRQFAPTFNAHATDVKGWYLRQLHFITKIGIVIRRVVLCDQRIKFRLDAVERQPNSTVVPVFKVYEST